MFLELGFERLFEHSNNPSISLTYTDSAPKRCLTMQHTANATEAVLQCRLVIMTLKVGQAHADRYYACC